MLLYIWVAVVVVAVWLYYKQAYSRFNKSNVKHFKPLPLLGNMAPVLLRTDHFAGDIKKLYDAFPGERFVGRYEFVNPGIMIKDLELVKKITIKDFEYFLDHRTLVNEKTDPFFGRNLFSLKGQEWKDMRSTLSPAFTSSKIRLMVPFMMEVGNQMMESIKKKIKESEEGYIDIDCKDLTTRYANDVIASCAFGLKVDSHADVDNDFYHNGKIASNFTFSQIITFFLQANFPKIASIFKITLFSASSKQFFKDLVLNTMNHREEKNIIRPDMIHLLMEAKKGRLQHEDKASQDTDAGFATVEESNVGKKNVDRVWSDIDLISQAVLFFIAGFETVSVAMSFTLHELALNPDVQEKLAKEIMEHDSKNGGKCDYTSIQNMTFMDMVVSESLRLWPPAVGTDRQCQKDYNLGKPNDEAGEDFIVRKGEVVFIPTWAFHHDPKLFPYPEKFDPERFSEENRHSFEVGAYMPFGIGPRNCIGSRFALCEVKIMLYQLLLHTVISPAAKTCMNSELSKENFNLKLKGGHWIRLKPRK